jgi:hypothetical protein
MFQLNYKWKTRHNFHIVARTVIQICHPLSASFTVPALLDIRHEVSSLIALNALIRLAPWYVVSA